VQAVRAKAPVPLCVDLDGTLTRGDTLLETINRIAVRSPWSIPRLVVSLIRGGIAGLKREATFLSPQDAQTLAWNEDFLAWLKGQAEAGRPVYLVTAADQGIADAVVASLGFLRGGFGSQAGLNLKGAQKREFLIDRFGEGGFDYAGNSHDDLDVWSASRTAIAVNASASVTDALRKLGKTEVREMDPPVPVWRTLVRHLRVSQWVKNLLILLPAFTSHRLTLENFLVSAIAIASFCLAASTIYALNDLLDLESDRRHPRKRNRPIAAGDLSIGTAWVLMLGTALASALLAYRVSTAFAGVVGVYVAAAAAYSFWVKRKLFADAVTLGFLYTIRVIAGGVALHIVLSPWLLGFCMFLFLSLALLKRYTELHVVATASGQTNAARGYRIEDIDLLAVMGVASGYIAAVILVVYTQSAAVSLLYREPSMLLFLCPIVLYFVSRLWLLASRRVLIDDPLIAAIKDRATWVMGAAGLGTVLAAL
jgi:4-hydroxybenzoate polyprenyltransferase